MDGILARRIRSRRKVKKVTSRPSGHATTGLREGMIVGLGVFKQTMPIQACEAGLTEFWMAPTSFRVPSLTTYNDLCFALLASLNHSESRREPVA